MDKSLVKMLTAHKDYEKGQTYEIDSDTASKWIDAELCVSVSPSDVLDAKISELESAIKTSQLDLVEKIKNSVAVEVDAPAVHGSKEKKSFGSFLKAVAYKNTDKLEGDYGSKVLHGDDGSSGGYTIPEDFRAEIMQVSGENTFARQRCFEVPMTTDNMRIPALDQTGTSSSRSNYFGGMYAAWNENDTDPVNAEPSFKEITLQARELSVYTKVHSYLLADSAISIETMLRRLFGEALGWHIDYAILNGSGVGEPLGILNSGVALGESRASDDIWDDSVEMLAKLSPQSMGRAVWVCHQTVMPQLLKMDDGTNAIYHPNVVSKPQLTLHGLPVVFTEKTPASGSAGDIMLCDFSQYVLGMRSDLSIAVSEHVDFLKGRLTYVVRSRMDGQPFMSAPITLADGSTKVSPFVYRQA